MCFSKHIFSLFSYLLNIYLEYFASLEKLDKLLEDYSFEKYTSYRNDILVIKNKVQLKTLENFPESKNLLFFIDILSLFNCKDDDDIEKLLNIINCSEIKDVVWLQYINNGLKFFFLTVTLSYFANHMRMRKFRTV